MVTVGSGDRVWTRERPGRAPCTPSTDVSAFVQCLLRAGGFAPGSPVAAGREHQPLSLTSAVDRDRLLPGAVRPSFLAGPRVRRQVTAEDALSGAGRGWGVVPPMPGAAFLRLRWAALSDAAIGVKHLVTEVPLGQLPTATPSLWSAWCPKGQVEAQCCHRGAALGPPRPAPPRPGVSRSQPLLLSNRGSCSGRLLSEKHDRALGGS